MWREHTVCRACNYAAPKGPPGIKVESSAEKLIEALDLGFQPPANDFCREGEERAGLAPLKVLLCPRCGLAQLSATVNHEILYKNYKYVTSDSQIMKEHFRSLWTFVKKECNPDSVLEIGSNNGALLQFAKDNGATSVCGIDPAENLSKVANDLGLHTYCGMFDEVMAKMARTSMPSVDLVMARHVFGHVDDMKGFINALDTLSNKETLILIEVPWVKRLLERCEFDTIYHEHLSYISIKSMVALLDSTPFRLHRIHEFPVHGGALAMMIRRRDHDSQVDSSVSQLMAQEFVAEETWRKMAECSRDRIAVLKDFVLNAVHEGKTVCGYGASAKATVWLNALGFTRREIKFVTDTTPQKQGCMIPGTDIPVVDPGALLREMPDFAIVWSWNYWNEITSKEQIYREKGGQFVNPHEMATHGA